jgi:hypothetical protein
MSEWLTPKSINNSEFINILYGICRTNSVNACLLARYGKVRLMTDCSRAQINQQSTIKQPTSTQDEQHSPQNAAPELVHTVGQLCMALKDAVRPRKKPMSCPDLILSSCTDSHVESTAENCCQDSFHVSSTYHWFKGSCALFFLWGLLLSSYSTLWDGGCFFFSAHF